MLSYLERVAVYLATSCAIVALLCGVIALGDAGQHGFAILCLVGAGLLAYSLSVCIVEDMRGE